MEIILEKLVVKMLFATGLPHTARFICCCMLLCCSLFAAKAQEGAEVLSRSYHKSVAIPADEQTEEYMPLLKGKKVAVVANHTAVIAGVHLVDTLLTAGVIVRRIFAPEHGFRGDADAGESIKDCLDSKTGIPMVSLYGKKKKPTASDLSDIDIVVFDIQDVGARFYTYISTLHNVMEACAENGKTLLILDRPNPNGHYVDGPVLQEGFKSFIGMHPVPIVHGMTVAEYARMLNGEGWLANGVQCALKYVRCRDYSHAGYYELRVKPSPNLPNMASVYLYPSLCLFEGTAISVGRGTDKPFQLIGHPDLKNTKIDFVPESRSGAAHPKLEGQLCHGFDLSDFGRIYLKSYRKIYLFWLISLYREFPDKAHFFNKNGMFNLLAGNDKLMEQIRKGLSEQEIRNSWQPGLENFLKIRKKYLLYEDFQMD